MYLRLSWLLIWGFAQSSVVGLEIGGNEALSEDLTSCLATVIDKKCPECKTVHLVLPLTPVWQSDALAELLMNGEPMYAMVISTIDQAGQRDFNFHYLTLYLIIDEQDLKAALKLASKESSKRRSVLLLDYNFDRDFLEYIWSFIEGRWKRFRNVVFMTLRNGEVQVAGMTRRKPGPNEFAQLHLCRKVDLREAIAESPQDPDREIQVMAFPEVQPYADVENYQMGGVLGNIGRLLTREFHVRPKYAWSKNHKEAEAFAGNHKESIAINFVAMRKMTDESHVITQLIDRNVWVVVNEKAQPFTFWQPFINSKVWIFVIQFVIHAMIILFLYKSPDKIKIVLHLFGMCFSNGIGWWPKETVLRALVFLWCIGTYFVTQAYLASLMSYLADFRSHSMIESLDDLVISGIPLYCNTNGKEFHCDLESKADRYICENCLNYEEDRRWQKFFANFYSGEVETTFAILTSEQVVRSSRILRQGNVLAQNSGYWHTMLFAGNDTVSLVRNITSVLGHLVDTGIVKYWFDSHEQRNRTATVNDAAENITILNVRNAFMILYVGWACSFVVFVIELLWKRYRGN